MLTISTVLAAGARDWEITEKRVQYDHYQGQTFALQEDFTPQVRQYFSILGTVPGTAAVPLYREYIWYYAVRSQGLGTSTVSHVLQQ